MLRRFRGHEPVLLSHLILFGYIYPTERDRIPQGVIDELFTLTRGAPAPDEKLCRGTFFSYKQYLTDINDWKHIDPRLAPRGTMTAEQIERWTKAPK